MVPHACPGTAVLTEPESRVPTGCAKSTQFILGKIVDIGFESEIILWLNQTSPAAVGFCGQGISAAEQASESSLLQVLLIVLNHRHQFSGFPALAINAK